ncbi:hypothetical protein QNM99_20950 [Pseudomonas sp. PCH446]
MIRQVMALTGTSKDPRSTRYLALKAQKLNAWRTISNRHSVMAAGISAGEDRSNAQGYLRHEATRLIAEGAMRVSLRSSAMCRSWRVCST